MSDDRPHVLHVVGDSEYGGASRVIVDLARAATDAGYRVSVLTTNERFSEELAGEGIGVQDLDYVRRSIRPWGDLRGLVGLARHIRQEGYSVVHTHTSKGGVLGRVAGRLGGAPLVIHTVHGYAFNDASPRLVVSLVSLVERVAAMFGDYVVTVSGYHAEVTISRRIAPPHKVVAIPNGIADVEPGATTSAEEPPPGEEGVPRILFFGRLATQKGVGYLVDAVALLRDRDVPAVVDVVGEGPLERDLREQVEELGLDGCVHFRGFVGSSEIAALLARSTLVVIPSLWEGMSISLLESLRAGRPVVTTSIPSNREVIGSSGCAVVVGPRDAEALALAIEQTIRDPHLLRVLGRRARERYLERFTLDGTARAYVDLYDRHTGATAAPGIGRPPG